MKKWWMFEVAAWWHVKYSADGWQLTLNQKECDEHAHYSYLKLSAQKSKFDMLIYMLYVDMLIKLPDDQA